MREIGVQRRAPVALQIATLRLQPRAAQYGAIGAPAEPSVRPAGRAAIFTVRPWSPEDGDPSRPVSVAGVAVARRVRTRRGSAGALVQLEDGRYAVTSAELVAVGGSSQLLRYCRERIRRAAQPEDRAWWQEAAGVVSQRAVA